MRALGWIVVASLVSLAALAGCGGQQTGGDDTMPTTPPAVTGPITIERTGGIAGMNQSIEIALDGSWVYTDRRQNKTERGTLTDAQRTQLVALVSAPGFTQQLLSPASPGGCADGFRYTVTVGSTKGSFEDCGGTEDNPALMAVLAAISETTPL